MISEALEIVELGLAEESIELGCGNTEEVIEKYDSTSAFYVEFSEG